MIRQCIKQPLDFNYACSDLGATPARTKNVKWKSALRVNVSKYSLGIEEAFKKTLVLKANRFEEVRAFRESSYHLKFV